MKQFFYILILMTLSGQTWGQVDVYWAEGLVQIRNFDGTTASNVTTGSSVSGFALDEVNGYLYYSELTDIIRYNLATTAKTTIFSGGGSIRDLAMDYANSKIYWTDFSNNTVSRANLDGSGLETLLSGADANDAFGIDIDPANNKVYFVELASSIRSFDLNVTPAASASSLQTLLAGADVTDARDVAVDPANNRMFWSMGSTSRIRTADLAGNSPADFVTGLSQPYGLAVDKDAGVLYFALFGADQIRRINTDGTSNALYVSTAATAGPVWITIPNAPPTPATALDFDGVDDQVVIPNDPAFSPTTGEITFECWAKSNTATWNGPSWVGLVSHRGSTIVPVTELRALVGRSGTNDLEFWMGTTFIAATVPDITQWHHYVGVYDGNNMYLYVDGVLAAQATTAIGILPLTDDVRIGYDAAGASFPNRYLNGTIDEVRIWDYARCGSEIIAQKDCELAGLETGLIAYYQFNEGVAAGTNAGVTTLPDISPNGHDGTLSSPPFALSGGTSNWVDGTANGVLGTCTPPSLPEVMVTEFLADPSGTDATDEWVEITNYGAVSYDLNAWTIEDEGVDNDPIASSSTTIAAGESYILARSKAQFESLWLGGCPNPYVLEVAGLTLANGPDEIIIKDDNGCRVHQVSFIGDERTGRATWYTEAFPPATRVWGANGVDVIDRQGNDATTGTLGYEENSTTADPNMRQAFGVADFGSPLENNSEIASIERGNTLDFDGADDYVAIGDIAALNFERTDAFSLEAWIKTTGGGFNYIVGKQNVGLNYSGYGLFTSDGSLDFQLINDYPVDYIWVSTPDVSINDGEWHHVAVTYSGNSDESGVLLYVDGKNIPHNIISNTLSASIQNTASFNIGDRTTTQLPFNGLIDEVRVWNGVRVADDIRENMHLTLYGCNAGLLSYYQLNEGSGTTVADKSGNGNDGTLTNMDPATDWVASGVNVGNGGGSNSETISNVPAGASTQTFAAANMTIEYLEHSAVEDVTVTYQAFTPNTTAGATGFDVFDNPMWTVNTSTDNTTQRMNLTFTFGSAPFIGVTDGSKYRLYWRPMYDDGNWTQLDGQATIISATDIQFTGLYVTGQFMVVEASTGEVSDVRGNMYSFDGIDDHIATNAFDFSSGDAMTIEAWIKAVDITTNRYYEISRQQDAGGLDWLFSFQDFGTRLTFALSTTNNAFSVLAIPITATDYTDGWHHVAAVYDGTTQAIYVDGNLIGSQPLTGNVNKNANNIHHIGRYPLGTEYFDGSMDEVRFWSTGRTQAEIRENMHLTLKGDETGLVSYYQFNNDDPVGTVGGVKDVSGNDGTTVNMVAADYVASEVAVAGGSSDIVNVTGTGDVTFPNTGVTINFNTTPNGEIVVSRLQTEKPTGWGTVGGDVDDEYFVVWNYGTDQAPVVNNMTFNGISHIPTTTATNEIALYKRGSRAYGATWGTAIANAASIVNHPVADVRFGTGALTTGFSQFVIVNNAANADLPIELMAFNANRETNDEVLLDWQTASELNNQGFYIERMLENETEFTAIGWIDGFGTTSEITHYEYNDDNAFTGVSYYRLRQVDFDGTETLSEVRAVNGSDLNVFSDVNIYPVPVRDELTVSFGKLPKGVNSGQVRIVDMQGRVIYEASVALASHQTLLIEEVTEWASGMYLLQIQLDNGSSMLEKFIKE